VVIDVVTYFIAASSPAADHFQLLASRLGARRPEWRAGAGDGVERGGDGSGFELLAGRVFFVGAHTEPLLDEGGVDLAGDEAEAVEQVDVEGMLCFSPIMSFPRARGASAAWLRSGSRPANNLGDHAVVVGGNLRTAYTPLSTRTPGPDGMSMVVILPPTHKIVIGSSALMRHSIAQPLGGARFRGPMRRRARCGFAL